MQKAKQGSTECMGIVPVHMHQGIEELNKLGIHASSSEPVGVITFKK